MNGVQYIENLKEQIDNGLLEIQKYINAKKELSPNIAFISELFIEELLNEIYKNKGYCFKNLNFESPNSPVIDLADEKNGICYQITVTNDQNNLKNKIKHTLEGFYARSWDTKYKKLFIIVASGITDKTKIPDNKVLNIKEKRIQINPELYTKKHVFDLADLSNIIFDNISNICIENVKDIIYKTPNRPERKCYSFNLKNYIERTVIDFENNKSGLLRTVNENKNCALIGIGGLGKTTEVDYLAHKLSVDPSNYCFKLKLINYADTFESLINSYCNKWANIPNKHNLFLLLDGLDEVNSSSIEKITNEIKQFSQNNPIVNILVTCRNNFNPFGYTKDGAGINHEFKTFYLNEITQSDIDLYVRNNSPEPERFLKSIKENKLSELFSNPFYLVNALEIFNSNGLIPDNKSSFFENLIEVRIGNEKMKNSSAFINVDEFSLIEGLKILALTMQFAGEYRIKKYDFDQILRNTQTRNIIKRIFFNNINDLWQFEHNNFQEFLAAELLASKGWPIIKEIIILENDKLKPKWLNAFSFLVNLLPNNNELIEWFIENDIETLVQVEPDNLELNTRNKIFKRVFLKHQNDAVGVWAFKYELQDLANIGALSKNPELIKLLLEVLNENDELDISKTNAFYLLNQINDLKYHIGEIKVVYQRYLKSNKELQKKYGRIIIDSFIKWNWIDYKIKETLLNNKNLIANNPIVITRYIQAGKFEDITGDQAFELIEAFNKKRVFGEQYSLWEVFDFLSPTEFGKLICKLGPDLNKGRNQVWFHEMYQIINDVAIKKYHGNPKIAEAICELVYSLQKRSSRGDASKLESFFRELNIDESFFREYFIIDYNDTGELRHRLERFALPALIAKNKHLKWAVDYIIDNGINEEAVKYFLEALSFIVNIEGYKYFINLINSKTNDRFLPKVSYSAKFELEKIDKWEQILISQDLCLKYIRNCFHAIGKNSISIEEVFDKQMKCFDSFDSGLFVALDILLNFRDDKLIDEAECIDWFSHKDNFEWFSIQEHSSVLKRKSLREENIFWIENWLEENQDKIEIKNTLTIKPNASFSWLLKTEYFIQFATYLNFKLNEKILLEFTEFIGLFGFEHQFDDGKKKYKVYDYVKLNVSQEKLNKQIIQNLVSKTLVSSVLYEHIKIVKKENIIEAIDPFLNYILDPAFDIHNKHRMFEVYKEFGGEAKRILPVLDNLSFDLNTDFFDWDIVEFLADNDVPETVPFLLKLKDKEISNKLQLGIWLIKLNQSIGFNIVLNNIKQGGNFNEYRYLGSIIENSNLEAFEINTLTDFLMSLYKKSIEMNYSKSHFRNLPDKISNKWFELIKGSKIDYKVLFKEIENILDKSVRNESYNNCYYIFNDLKDKVNTHLDSSIVIRESIAMLKASGFNYDI